MIGLKEFFNEKIGLANILSFGDDLSAAIFQQL